MVQKTENDNAIDFDSQIECSVNALLELDKITRKKNTLLDDGQTIFLQVTIFKIPELDEFIKRKIVLKHPTFGGVPEVCLIVKDFIKRDKIKRTGDEMIDISIERFEELLKKHKVTGISNIMPYYQFKMEYNTFELKRKLVNRFDVILCHQYLFGRDHFFDCLGKIFIKKKKYPIPVRLPKWNDDYDPKVNKRIQSAIASTVFYLRPSSDNFSIRIGNTNNSKEAIIDNLKVVIDKIMNSNDLIPGGFKNIRLMNIKTERSKAVPLYISLSSGNDIPIPYVASNVPVVESVEDEISTRPGKKITVLPGGEIFVTRLQPERKPKLKTKKNKKTSVDKESIAKKSKTKAGKKEMEKKLKTKAGKKEMEKKSKTKAGKKKIEKKSGNKKKKIIEEGDSDNDSDYAANGKNENESYDIEDAIESAEQKYLSSLNDQFESSEDEKEDKKKVKKGTKRKLKETPRPLKKMKKEKPVKAKSKQKIVKSLKSKKMKQKKVK